MHGVISGKCTIDQIDIVEIRGIRIHGPDRHTRQTNERNEAQVVNILSIARVVTSAKLAHMAGRSSI